MARAKKPTQTERVRLSLADAIVRGEIGPGMALDEASIAQKYRVSRTPVREAIRHLEAIGFAEARPHRGAVVPLFTPEKINEMFTVMAEMEALCARYAARHISDDDRDSLVRLHDDCRDAARRDDAGSYYVRNISFHDAIYHAGQNAFLAEITLTVRNRVAPFRKLQFEREGRLSESLIEHEQIVEAILRADEDAAASLMRDHLLLVRKSVGSVSPAFSERPEPARARHLPADPTSGLRPGR